MVYSFWGILKHMLELQSISSFLEECVRLGGGIETEYIFQLNTKSIVIIIFSCYMDRGRFYKWIRQH